MNIQSLSVCVPAKHCINDCEFCCSKMHGGDYVDRFTPLSSTMSYIEDMRNLVGNVEIATLESSIVYVGILFNIVSNFSISYICNPVVGSSRINKLLPVGFFCNSLANLTLAASPPDNVGAL